MNSTLNKYRNFLGGTFERHSKYGITKGIIADIIYNPENSTDTIFIKSTNGVIYKLDEIAYMLPNFKTMKTYILIKDLPECKAGTEYLKCEQPIGDHYYIPRDENNPTLAGKGKIYVAEIVENNPEWFKEKKDFNNIDIDLLDGCQLKNIIDKTQLTASEAIQESIKANQKELESVLQDVKRESARGKYHFETYGYLSDYAINELIKLGYEAKNFRDELLGSPPIFGCFTRIAEILRSDPMYIIRWKEDKAIKPPLGYEKI